MSHRQSTTDDDKDAYEYLKQLRNSHDMRVVSVRSGSGGIKLYKSCTRVGNEPAIEIPHTEPSFADASRDYADFRTMILCNNVETITRNNHTYVVYNGDNE